MTSYDKALVPQLVKLARSAVLAGGALAVSGCVNIGQLNKEVLAKSGDVSASVPMVDCAGDATPPAPKAMLAQITARSASLRASNAVLDMAGMSDMEAGRALIEGAAGYRAGLSSAASAAVPAGQLLNSLLGWRLEALADDMPRLDQAAAIEARAALEGSEAGGVSVQQLADFFSQSAVGANRAEGYLHIDRDKFGEMLGHLSTATAENGWTSDLTIRLGHFANSGGLKELVSGRADLIQLRDLQRSYLITIYTKAYFRNGQIFQLNFTDADLKQKLKDSLATHIGDPKVQAKVDGDIDNTAGLIFAALCPNAKNDTCHALGIIGEQTFVTRAGKSYGFPGVTATIAPGADKKISTNKIDTDALISDLIRVAVEATADANLGVPGVPNSTACSLLSRLCASKAAGDPNFVTDDQVAKISDAGDRVEAATTAGVSVIIRGGWLFSLNNETLAKSIETVIGVSARKAAEYAAWKTITKACGVPAQGPYKRFSVSFSGVK